ncbi:MAG: hypothetical protein J0L66_13890 [Cytophagales bacterium]|nr:hypothetical protein [Cytophagales bacterium]
MKAALALILILVTGVCLAQTPVTKSYPVKQGQGIALRFDYPQVVRISTWDKNEIAITGTVSINGGEHDQAFELLSSESEGRIYIENRINDLKNLPRRITITRGTEKITFKSQEDYDKYCEQYGRGYQVKNWGTDIEILLEVKVPRNTDTQLECVYGIAEVKNFYGPLSVKATYGGVDVAIQEKSTGELTAETNYGQIYTNLDTKFQGVEDRNFHMLVKVKPGSGPRYSFESKYGNVYLRKAL